MRFLLRRVLAAIPVLAALVALFWSSPAAAQSVALTGTVTPNPDLGSRHPQGVPVGVINHADCLADETIHIPLLLSGTFTGSTGLALEAWVGESQADCTQPDTRATTTASCWPLKQGISAAQYTSVDIRVQDIVHQLGQPTPKKVTAAESIGVGTAADCDSSVITSGPHGVRISIFFTNLSTAQGTGATWDATVAMTANALPGGITAQGADTIIKVSLPSNPDTSIKGYDFYCDAIGQTDASGGGSTNDVSSPTVDAQCPVPDSGPTPVSTDASTDADAADDSGSVDSSVPEASASFDAASCGIPTNPSPPTNVPTNGTCSSSVLGAGTTSVGDSGTTTGTGKQTSGLDAYHCGHVDNTSTDATITTFQGNALVNGQVYAVAAAATDQYGNVGPLSPPACATPQPVNDFWNVYTEAGGKAGGNFCALDAAGMPAGVAVFGGGMALAAMAMIRRRRRS